MRHHGTNRARSWPGPPVPMSVGSITGCLTVPGVRLRPTFNVRCREMRRLSTSVPPDGPVELGAVRLGEGRQLDGREPGPLLWATNEPVSQPGLTWLELHYLQAETGLAPILLRYLHKEDGRPWDSGELDGGDEDLSLADRLDPAEVIASSWNDSLDPDDDDPEQLDQIAPFGIEFPGLAPAQDEALDRGELRTALASLAPARIGLVPAARPADVLQLIGFLGSVNRYGSSEQLVAALRSWESRFGAVLVELGFADFTLLVKRPPRTLRHAQAAAAELWAMSDEFWMVERPGHALTEVGEIAEYLVGAPFWSLWLD
jgi:Domain of unknown function (DUF4253)